MNDNEIAKRANEATDGSFYLGAKRRQEVGWNVMAVFALIGIVCVVVIFLTE